MSKNKNNIARKINNSFLKRNIITLTAFFALMIVAIVATILVLNAKKEEQKFMAYNGFYNSDQVSSLVDNSSKPSQKYKKISD